MLQRTEPGDRFWEFLGQLQDRRSSTITLILLCGIGALLISPSRTRVLWSIGIGIVAMAGILGVGIYGSRALLAVLIDNSDTVRAAQSIHEALLGRSERPSDGHGPHRRADDCGRRRPGMAMAQIRPHTLPKRRPWPSPTSNPVV